MIMANKTKEDYDNDVMVVRIEALKLSVFVRLISGEHESDMRLELLRKVTWFQGRSDLYH